jgi:hypothetical protein
MIEYKAELEKKMLGLRELKNKGEYTREEYVQVSKEIGEIRNSIQIARANHHMDVYELLDLEQKAVWNDLSRNFPRHDRNVRHHRKGQRFD